jgi:plastocyanin
MRRSAVWLVGWACALAQAAPLDVQVVDAKGQPLAGAVVFVESAAARAAAKPLAGVEVAQEKRQFLPAASVVTVGSAVTFPNRDTVRHHVYSFTPTKFELKLYSGRPANPVVFDRPGVAVLGCNIHDEMVGWVVVVETPWHGTTGADGRVQLDVPAGPHRLRAWHLGLPVGAPAADQALVQPAAGGTARVALTLEGGAR